MKTNKRKQQTGSFFDCKFESKIKQKNDYFMVINGQNKREEKAISKTERK